MSIEKTNMVVILEWKMDLSKMFKRIELELDSGSGFVSYGS